jgi:hypothetical protein
MATMKQMLKWVSGGLAVLLVVSGTAFAQPPRPAGLQPARLAEGPARTHDAPTGRAKVEVMVVYANKSGQVDPRAADVQRQLSSLGFTGCQVLSTHDAQLGPNQETTFNAVGGRRVQLTLNSRTEETANVRIEVNREAEMVVDTRVNIHRGRSMILAAGKHQDGKLVLVVTVD